MKIEFGDVVDFKIPLAELPIKDVSVRLLTNGIAIKVFVLQTAHDQMVEHVNQDKNIECGGVLVGYPFQNQETQETFVVIVGVIPDISSNRSIVHFTVTPDTISRTREILERDFPELIAVGWYHSHPGHGVFLSNQDMTIVKGIYSEFWNLAWVIDPVKKNEGIFCGAEGSPVIANISEHSLFERENRIWFPLTKVPQCIVDLQEGRITYSEKMPIPHAGTKIIEGDIASSAMPYREVAIKNKPSRLKRGMFYAFSIFTLIFLCVSLFITMPGFLVGTIIASVLSILMGLYILLRFVLDNSDNGNSVIRKEPLFALFMVFSLSFFWLFAFLANYIGFLSPVVSTETLSPTTITIPTAIIVPTETVIPTATIALTETPVANP